MKMPNFDENSIESKGKANKNLKRKSLFFENNFMVFLSSEKIGYFYSKLIFNDACYAILLVFENFEKNTGVQQFYRITILAHFIISESNFKYLGFKKGASSGDRVCC